jgi:predicted dehydrogenase
MSGPVGVAICGLGRSGWHLHAAALARLEGCCRVVAAFDPDAARTQEAASRFGFHPPRSFESLLADPAVELVVLAVPTHLHEALALAALAARKHVVVEKPFATSVDSATRMIEAARRADRLLTCSQNLRFFPDFAKVREVIDSGTLGTILQVRIAWHRFRRRWDWQTLQACGGGNLNNEGSHVVDQGLLLFGPGEPRVFVERRRSQLCMGDAENHVKIVLSGPGAPLVDIELTDTSAYEQAMWMVMGSYGGLTGTRSRLEWKYIDPRELPPRTVSIAPTSDRSFNAEEYRWHTGNCEFTGDAYAPSFRAFYVNVFDAVRGQREPAVTLDSLLRQTRVLEQCRSAVTG